MTAKAGPFLATAGPTAFDVPVSNSQNFENHHRCFYGGREFEVRDA